MFYILISTYLCTHAGTLPTNWNHICKSTDYDTLHCKFQHFAVLKLQEINPSLLPFPFFPTVLFLGSVFGFYTYKIQKIKKKSQSKSSNKQNRLPCANKIVHLRGGGRYLVYKAIFVPATSALSSLIFVL